ncbi:MAG: hypothetical protein IJ796_09745 [Lachnospiraceae bacterium]|nr:hypothetical protein [Lachnospiraceae bacterium]
MAGTYRDNSSSAEENKSSGIVLLATGVLGAVFVTLGMTKVIPLNFGNPYLFYGLLCAISALFLATGIVSFISAGRYGKKAKGEKGVKQEITEWACENLSAGEIDRLVEVGTAGDTMESGEEKSGVFSGTEPVTATEEEKYFSRCRVISDKLNEHFVNLNPDMLEDLIDKVIYDRIFEDAG